MRDGVRSLLFPRSIALIGASPRRPAPVINAAAGAVPAWGVHPEYQSVMGLPCVQHLTSLAEVPETAVLLIGHERIEAALDEAIEAGVRSFVIHGLGHEAGPEGGTIAGRVAARVSAVGGVLLGPNCMGVAVPGEASTWLAALPDSFRRGHVAAIVQSGSVGEALVALGPRVGFRAVVSCGAEALVSVSDLVTFFADDPEVRAIALFLETVRDAEGFARALERGAANGKPVVCLKVGRSEVAARAALAHTGAIVGSELGFSAVLRRYGALEVQDLPELVETIEVLGRRRWPHGVRTAAVSESGGEAALFGDAGERRGLVFPEVPAEVAAELSRRFPLLKHAANPIDAWAIDMPERIFPQSMELLARSNAFDIIVGQVDLSRFRDAADQAWNEVIVRGLAAALDETPLFGAIVTSHTTDPPDWAYMLAEQFDIALLRGVDDAAAALARVATWQPYRGGELAPSAAVDLSDLVKRPGPLPEHESSAILERYGVVFAPRRRASNPDEAMRVAGELGWPVVVKADGPAHKSRSGGVITNIASPEATQDAASRLGGRVLVARQISGTAEIFCGMTRDPQFGPVLVVGRGGTAVEQTRPAVAVIGPIAPEHASALLAQVHIDDPGASVAHVLASLGRLAADHPNVTEIDVNPLISTETGAVAVDALVVVGPEARTD